VGQPWAQVFGDPAATHEATAAILLRVKVEEYKPRPVSTAHAPVFAPEQAKLYRDVLRLLNERGVPYAVSGAFALQQHTGIWRDTKDLDLFLCAADASVALRHLCDLGFECEVRDPYWLAKAHRGDYYVDLITGMSNAVLSVDRLWIERSLPAVVFDVETRVLGAEELFASKLFVLFRERFDGADLVHIIYGTRGKLDWQRILQLVGEHRELLLVVLALFHYVYPHARDMVPRGVWELATSELEDDDPHKPVFRGTLLDENMFAIDVKDWGLPDPLQASRAKKSEIIRPLSEAA
jgi:hypothetical protein